MVLASVGCAAMGQVVQTPKGYDFHSAYHTGQQLNYQVSMAVRDVLPNPDQNVGLMMSESLKVLKVKDGITTFLSSSGSLKSVKQSPIGAPQKTRKFSVDRRNRSVGSGLGSFALQVFPDHPVKMGSSWTSLATMPVGSSSGLAVQATYRLDSVKEDHGKRVFSIAATFKGIATGDGAVLVNAANGEVELLVTNWSLTVKQEQKRVQIIVKRVP